MRAKFLFSLAVLRRLLRADRGVEPPARGRPFRERALLRHDPRHDRHALRHGRRFRRAVSALRFLRFHQVESSAGGFVYMAASLFYIAATVAIEAVPSDALLRPLRGRRPVVERASGALACAGGLAALNAAAFALPWTLGRRTWNAAEASSRCARCCSGAPPPRRTCRLGNGSAWGPDAPRRRADLRRRAEQPRRRCSSCSRKGGRRRPSSCSALRSANTGTSPGA